MGMIWNISSLDKGVDLKHNKNHKNEEFHDNTDAGSDWFWFMFQS